MRNSVMRYEHKKSTIQTMKVQLSTRLVKRMKPQRKLSLIEKINLKFKIDPMFERISFDHALFWKTKWSWKRILLMETRTISLSHKFIAKWPESAEVLKKGKGWNLFFTWMVFFFFWAKKKTNKSSLIQISFN